MVTAHLHCILHVLTLLFYTFGFDILFSALRGSPALSGITKLPTWTSTATSVLTAIFLLPLQIFGFLAWGVDTIKPFQFVLRLLGSPYNQKVAAKVRPYKPSTIYLPDRCIKRRIWKSPELSTSLERIAFPQGLRPSDNLQMSDLASAIDDIPDFVFMVVTQFLVVITILRYVAHQYFTTKNKTTSTDTPTIDPPSTPTPSTCLPKLIPHSTFRKHENTDSTVERLRRIVIDYRRNLNMIGLQQRHQRWFHKSLKDRTNRPHKVHATCNVNFS
jgi:hypothetical protein